MNLERNNQAGLDTEKLELNSSYGPIVTLGYMKASLEQSRKIVKLMKQSHKNVGPLIKILQSSRPSITIQRPGLITKEVARDMFLREINSNLKHLRNLSCPLTATQHPQVSQKLKTAIDKINEDRLVICAELLKTVPDFNFMADMFLPLNRLILDMAILMSSVLETNMRKFDQNENQVRY
jgi:hypothetical protein